MKEKIAEIKLSPGQVGFYDELTNIHLTIASPFGQVYRGMNTSRIKASVASKKLILLSGTLSLDEVIANEAKLAETAKIAEVAEKTVEVKEAKDLKTVNESKAAEEAPETEEAEVTEEAPEVDEVKEAPVATKTKSKKK